MTLKSSGWLWYAPYAWDAQAPGLAFDTALLPANVREAEYHLSSAIELARQDELKNFASNALQRVHRFAVWPGWNNVHKLLKSRNSYKDAYEVAVDLMEATWKHRDNQEEPVPPHPMNVRNAAIALSHWPGENEKQGAKEEIIRLFEDALRFCSAFPKERKFNELQVLPYFAKYLATQGADQIGRLREVDRWILDLLEEAQPGTHVPGEWFERVGDREPTHAKAVLHYLRGLDHAPQWYQLWLKAIGAAKIGNTRLGDIKVRLAKLTEDERVTVLDKALVAYNRQVGFNPWQRRKRKDRHVDGYVLDRWDAARAVLETVWGDSLRCSDILHRW